MQLSPAQGRRKAGRGEVSLLTLCPSEICRQGFLCHRLNKLCAALSWLSRPGFQEHMQQSMLLTQAIPSPLIPQHYLTEPAGMAGCRASWQRQGLPKLRAGGSLPSSVLCRSCGELSRARLTIHVSPGTLAPVAEIDQRQPSHPSQTAGWLLHFKKAQDLGHAHTHPPRAPGNTRNSREPCAGRCTVWQAGPQDLPSLPWGLCLSCRARRQHRKLLQTHWRGELGNLEFKCFGSLIRLTFTVIWS